MSEIIMKTLNNNRKKCDRATNIELTERSQRPPERLEGHHIVNSNITSPTRGALQLNHPETEEAHGVGSNGS